MDAAERPVGTSSTHNCVWHGYSPYNPEMVRKYLTVFRAVNNWVHVSERDGTAETFYQLLQTVYSARIFARIS